MQFTLRAAGIEPNPGEWRKTNRHLCALEPECSRRLGHGDPEFPDPEAERAVTINGIPCQADSGQLLVDGGQSVRPDLVPGREQGNTEQKPEACQEQAGQDTAGQRGWFLVFLCHALFRLIGPGQNARQPDAGHQDFWSASLPGSAGWPAHAGRVKNLSVWSEKDPRT